MSYNPYMGRLESYLQSCGIGQYDKYERFLDRLFEWNQKFNLTAIADRADAEDKHIIDSLLGAEYVRGDTVLDIGAGAGFPSVPLAIAMPDKKFTLADSLGKRVKFLEFIIDDLPLENVRAIHARAEDLPKTELYDTVTARAVAPLNVLVEYCLPFVKPGGVMLAYKAAGVTEELAAAERGIGILGGGEPVVYSKTLCTTREETVGRTFVVIEKVRPTPKAYPRGGNKPRLKPL